MQLESREPGDAAREARKVGKDVASVQQREHGPGEAASHGEPFLRVCEGAAVAVDRLAEV